MPCWQWSLHARTWLFFKSTSGQKSFRLVPATIYTIEEQQSDEWMQEPCFHTSTWEQKGRAHAYHSTIKWHVSGKCPLESAVTVKMDLSNLVPLGITLLTPRNLFHYKSWTPLEKFGPLPSHVLEQFKYGPPLPLTSLVQLLVPACWSCTRSVRDLHVIACNLI